MNTQNKVIDMNNYKIDKTLSLFLAKTKQLDEKLNKFLEDKDGKPRANGKKA